MPKGAPKLDQGVVVLDIPKQGAPAQKDLEFESWCKWIDSRIVQLKESRKKKLDGKDIEVKWRELDKLYQPHECTSTALEDWQSKNSSAIPYSKVQSAISIVARQNVTIVPQPMSAEYESKNEFIRGLTAKIKEKGAQEGQWALFEQSRTTKGFAVGRVYHRKIVRLIDEVVNVDPITGKDIISQNYKVDFDDPYFEAKSIYDCWIDDAARPYDRYSCADWCWKENYRMEEFQRLFPTSEFPRAAFVQPKSGVEKNNSENKNSPVIIEGADLVECMFYENWKLDKMAIKANDVWIDIFPLPYRHKMLSLVYAHWTLRDENSIEGIGLIESLQQDHEMLDKIRNMGLDQLVLSIWQPFLYSGGEEFDNMSKVLRPGKGIKVNDPRNINWMNIPSGNIDAMRREEMLKNDIDDACGITKTLSGEIIGKTVYEAEQNRQAGMRKLSNPIRALEGAVEWAWNLLIPIAQQVYSTPIESSRVIGKGGLTAYEMLLQSDPNNVQVNPGGTVATFQPRVMRMPMEQDEKGNMIPTEQDKDITLTEDLLKWEGRIKIKAFSMMPDDPFTERETYKELYGLLFSSPNADIYKLDKELCKQYGKLPNDLLKTEEEIAAAQQAAKAPQMGVGMEMPIGIPQEQIPNEQMPPQEEVMQEQMPGQAIPQQQI